MTKWGGRPHWEFSGHYLGADGHGHWVGFPAGTDFRRPGMHVTGPVDQVTLVPADGSGWVATFHAPGGEVFVYVDLVDTPVWVDLAEDRSTRQKIGAAGALLRCVDLDLDVVRLPDGEVYLDDEEEFAEHQRLFHYPTELVARVRRDAAALLDAVRRGDPPFDGLTSARWLAR